MYTGPTVKKRDIHFGSGQFYTSFGGSKSPMPWSIVGKQETASTDSLWPIAQRELRNKHTTAADKKRIRDLDLGTNFFQTTTNFYEDSRPSYFVQRRQFGDFGQLCTTSADAFARSEQVGPSSLLWPQLSAFDWNTLVTAGTTAIARTVPNNPTASVLRSLLELREGLPQVPLKALRRGHFKPGDIGGEYLNIIFGIVPTIKDMLDYAEALKNSHAIIQAFLDNAGKNIFRRYQFPVTKDTAIIEIQQGVPISPAGITQSYDNLGDTIKGTRSLIRHTTRRIWFEGVYTYTADPGSTPWERMKYAYDLIDKVEGTAVTPDVLYQIMPWSWLSEWVWNLGDVMKNLSAFQKDGLVMRRGYVMMETTIRDVWTLSGISHPAIPSTISQTFGTKSKARLKATPYGFGVDWGGFTPSQLSILAALGISRFGR